MPSFSSSSSSAPQPPLPIEKRAVRVRRAERSAGAARTGGSAPSSRLPADSLGYSLLLAARVLAGVYAGKSLNPMLSLLAGEAAAARAAAQDVVYGVLRAYGRGEFFLGRLMARPLSHAETRALLLAALYRLETRPEGVAMVVDQAVAASGELSGGALKPVVNGVLRNFLRQRERLLVELRQDRNDAAYFQHPAWWLARLRRAYPDDWRGIVAAGNGPPPMTLRVNTRR
ncbi:MAG: hypothetical protein LBS49_13130, partial [Candidatus Accumulibacter sp.]|nr:hypothetical protein [Accumulibacter sp.]